MLTEKDAAILSEKLMELSKEMLSVVEKICALVREVLVKTEKNQKGSD